MNRPAGPTRARAECLPPNKAGQLGSFVPAPAEPDRLLDPGSDEFWAEMHRRVESNEPAIPAEEVLALFPKGLSEPASG